MDVWQTSCPHVPAWEDAVANGLIAVVPGDVGIRGYTVELTAEGPAVLDCKVG